MSEKALPFLYGAEYYRAPTPDREHWREDLSRMAENGFNAVKFFVQWRWVHRDVDRWYFDDIDELMELAGGVGLSVTMNLIFDTSPTWLFRKYPDAHMITARGDVLESRAVACRSVGGYPGPCLNHPQAWVERERFIRQVVGRYGKHQAMGMWDVWNEPESCLFLRKPDDATLVCYCRHCHEGFAAWLRRKYGDIERLNRVWGRCYDDFSEIELPRDRQTLTDMVDWRLFCLDSLAWEGRRRLDSVRAVDGAHPVYLHPVPNTWHFNAVMGVDTFRMADGCDCFAGSVLEWPLNPLHIVSAGDGRVCYSAETHIRSGMTGMYPRDLDVQDIAWELVPQIGLGIRGFLFWQYRCETLGMESPGWGLLDPDGKVGATHDAASEFWRRLRPVAEHLMTAPVEPASTAIYQSSAGEIFHWCTHGDLSRLRASIDNFTRVLYERNVRLTYVNEQLIQRGLADSIKLLILTSTTVLDQATALVIVEWVRKGGILLCEGCTGEFDLTSGRHSRILPGLGMAEAFDLTETNPTATVYMDLSGDRAAYRLSAHVCRAFEVQEKEGGRAISLKMEGGGVFQGRLHYCELAGDGIERIAGLPGRAPCIGFKHVGSGGVFYVGTKFDWLKYAEDPEPFSRLLSLVLQRANVEEGCSPWRNVPLGVRIDRLRTQAGEAYAMVNKTPSPARLRVRLTEPVRGLFTDQNVASDGEGEFLLPSGHADLAVPVRWMTR